MTLQDGEQPGPSPIAVEVDPRMEDLVSAYLERCRGDAARIPELIRGGELDTVRALADRMAGSGGAYGFSDVSTLGFEIERAARAGDRCAVDAAVGRLTRYLSAVRIVRSTV